MKNDKFDKKLNCISKINEERKGIYKERILDFCNCMYHENAVQVWKRVVQCDERYSLKVAVNRF